MCLLSSYIFSFHSSVTRKLILLPHSPYNPPAPFDKRKTSFKTNSFFNPTRSLFSMAGFLTYTTTGIFLLLISSIEFLSPTLPLPLPRSLPFILSSSLSLLAILNSIITSLLAADPIGPPLPLSSLPVAALFLLLSLSSLLPLPLPLLNLLSLFSFASQFLLFSLRNHKDPDGLENQYFDLLLVPIFVCLVSSLVSIARPKSPFPRLARAAGLALQGSWFLQMAFSLFTSAIAHGCVVDARSGGDFTVVCGGKADMHRSRAIATLQFNCHLAFFVALGVGVYGVLVGRGGGGIGEYRVVGKELRRMEHVSAADFTLDSDDDDEERRMGEEIDGVSVAVNGFGGAH